MLQGKGTKIFFMSTIDMFNLWDKILLKYSKRKTAKDRTDWLN